eukprot:scaffold28388_cov76-Phaeocystis_antarctica.AAC.2
MRAFALVFTHHGGLRLVAPAKRSRARAMKPTKRTDKSARDRARRSKRVPVRFWFHVGLPEQRDDAARPGRGPHDRHGRRVPNPVPPHRPRH